jgi:HAD superfamily hydrolase (TIGR01509 family)
MDGVLVDSEDAWVARERGDLLPRVVPDASVSLAEITGMNYRDIYDYLAAEYEVAMTKPEFLAWYDEAAETVYGEEVSLLPGAAALVADLRATGVPVALVSSSPVAWIDVVLERFGLAFDDVVSGDDFDGPGKPDPALYRRATDRLGVAPADTVAVEDSVHGIEAARRAGLTVVGFRFGDDEGTDFANADCVPAGPEELVATLRERADLA